MMLQWVAECKLGLDGRWIPRRYFKTRKDAYAWVNTMQDWRLVWNVRRTDTQSD